MSEDDEADKERHISGHKSDGNNDGRGLDEVLSS